MTYQEVLIDFSEISSGTILSDQCRQWAVFTSDPPGEVRVLYQTFANSVEDWVCPSLDSDCSNDLFIDFAAPVTDIRFSMTLVHTDGRTVIRDGVVLGERDLFGTGAHADVIDVDLSGHPPVDRLELVDVDDYFGIGYDDFRFGFPEPGSG